MLPSGCCWLVLGWERISHDAVSTRWFFAPVEFRPRTLRGIFLAGRMKRSAYYGRLNVASLDHEAHDIWLTRDVELPETTISWKWSWEHEDRVDERVEMRDFVAKLIAAAPLEDRHLDVIRSILQDETLEDVAKRWGVTRERVRQVQAKAIRLLRQHSSKITDIPASEIDPSVDTWWWYSLKQQHKRNNGKTDPIPRLTVQAWRLHANND